MWHVAPLCSMDRSNKHSVVAYLVCNGDVLQNTCEISSNLDPAFHVLNESRECLRLSFFLNDFILPFLCAQVEEQ